MSWFLKFILFLLFLQPLLKSVNGILNKYLINVHSLLIRNSEGNSNNNPFIVESDNGANCEVLSPVMEDERVSTVASTAPDRTLLLSANHHRAPAPKYRPPPPYNQIRSGASKSSINHIEYGGHTDDDYAEYAEDDYRNRGSPLHQSLAHSPEMGEEVYYAHEYTPRRHLESDGTMRSNQNTPRSQMS